VHAKECQPVFDDAVLKLGVRLPAELLGEGSALLGVVRHVIVPLCMLAESLRKL
jgi:hypothetical protein